MLTVWARHGQVVLGLAYLALGTVRALPGSSGALAEPLLLVGGGLLVLVGASGAVRSPIAACAVVWVGGVLGFAPSIGTVLLPLLALFVLDTSLVDTGHRVQAEPD